MSVTMVTSEANTVIREGWKVLVEQMGLQKATQFLTDRPTLRYIE